MQSTSLRSPNQYEKERIDAMVRLGCVACASLGIPYAEVEVHHILDGGVRMGHWWTIPLCAGHHRGEFTVLQRELIPDCAREKRILVDSLVSISSGRRVFARAYGTERDLWETVQKRLHLTMVWPPTKILPRRQVC